MSRQTSTRASLASVASTRYSRVNGMLLEDGTVKFFWESHQFPLSKHFSQLIPQGNSWVACEIINFSGGQLGTQLSDCLNEMFIICVNWPCV